MGRSPAAAPTSSVFHHHHHTTSTSTATAQDARPGALHRSADPFDPGGSSANNDGRYESPVPDLRSSTATPSTRTSTSTTDGGHGGGLWEMDHLHPDDHQNSFPNDDEEAGLSTHERRKRWHMRRRQRRQLDSRVVDLKITTTGRRLADRNVVKKLAINVLFIFLWYLFSLSISVYNKWMFSPDHLNFPYPLFTTSLHMVVQFILASIILYFVPSLRPRQPASQFPNSAPRPSAKPLVMSAFYLTRLVPCGSATSLDVGLGNMSLRFVTLSFLTMCKSSALGFVLLFAFLFRLETPSVKLILVICFMIAGVVMMVAGEPDFSVLGFALVIASAFFSGFRWGLTQILLLRHPATSNPFSTLFLLTPIMFVSLVIISLLVEGFSEIVEGIQALALQNGTVKGFLFLIFPGNLAFCMIASEFALLKRSSVVTLSICGIFKEVITIIAGGSVFDDKLTPVKVTGLVVMIGSIGSYNYMKITKMRKDARKDVAITTTDLGYGSDDEEGDSQPQTTDAARPSLFDRLGASFGMSSGNRETDRYQPVYTPTHSPVETQFAPGSVAASPVADGRGRSAFRVRVSGPPGSSSLGGTHSASTSAPPSDTESVHNSS